VGEEGADRSGLEVEDVDEDGRCWQEAKSRGMFTCIPIGCIRHGISFLSISCLLIERCRASK